MYTEAVYQPQPLTEFPLPDVMQSTSGNESEWFGYERLAGLTNWTNRMKPLMVVIPSDEK